MYALTTEHLPADRLQPKSIFYRLSIHNNNKNNKDNKAEEKKCLSRNINHTLTATEEEQKKKQKNISVSGGTHLLGDVFPQAQACD